MVEILIFATAFCFSFLGSIPPGVINLTIIQLGLEHRQKIAWRFAIASGMVEYPYAWLAIKFERLISSSPVVVENLQLASAIVMITFGALNLWSARRPTNFSKRLDSSGFRRGILLGILNPMALPFWVGITAYLRSLHWIHLDTTVKTQFYLCGVVAGAITILMAYYFLAKRVSHLTNESQILRYIPGAILLSLGLFSIYDYLT